MSRAGPRYDRGVDAVDVGRELLAAIAARDPNRIAACFADDAVFWVLTPRPQVREHTGPEQAAERYTLWFGAMQGFEVLETDVAPVADRVRIRYLIRGRDPEQGWQVNDHTAYARVADGAIRTLTLSCAGFRPTDAPA